jgi:tetratricopeptide (TPR) repeat protein
MKDAGPEMLSLFHGALERRSPEERAAFLDAACGRDTPLRQRLEVLLRAHERAGAFLPEGPATSDSANTTVERSTTDQPGRVLAGRYTLLEVIGAGGMGTVWKAEQSEPLRRLVAVKLIKAGMDSRSVLARFEVERQALALMDHPNIARVLDAGVDPDGRPFFVMELVEGVPITRFCDEQRLTPRQRLGLFVPVCQAIQHAHQKGVIHRDVKPSNVLVALCDGKPAPKVIDFGVAKATAGQLTDETLLTGFGAVVGTVEYMSPEQASLNALDVDTRSDVYALGVLLYELLTGSPPFPRREMAQAGLLELLRVIREQEPARPSTRLSTAEGLPGLAANRGMDPKRLPAVVRGELDWIVMKALEKDRGRRYESANALAADLQRYLSDEAVQACPPSAGYRLRKFVRRNKGPVAAVAIVLIALVGGIVGMGWGLAAEARRAEKEHLARLEVERERDEKEKAGRLASANEKKARRNQQRAQDVLDEMSLRVVRDWLSRQPRLTADQTRFLMGAQELYEAFTQEVGATPDQRRALARACSRLGDIHSTLGRHKEARAAYGRSLAVSRSLRRQHPDEPTYAYDLANTLINLAVLQARLGERGEELKSYEAARVLIEPLARDALAAPERARTLMVVYQNIALIRMELGQYVEALRAQKPACALADRLHRAHRRRPDYAADMARVWHNLGKLAFGLGRWEEALAAHEKARTLWEQLVRSDRDEPEYVQGLARTHLSRGNAHMERGEGKETFAAYEAARALFGPLFRRHPGVPQYARELAITLHTLGGAQMKFGRPPAEALKSFDAALALREALVENHPEVPEYTADLGVTHSRRALVQKRLGQLAEARKSLDAARALQEPLVERRSGVSRHAVELGDTYLSTGNLVADGGDLTAAVGWYDRAIAVLEPMSRRRPIPVEAGEELRNSHWARGMALAGLDRKREALACYQAGRLVAERLARDHHSTPGYAADLAAKCHALARLQGQLGRRGEALKSLEAARAVGERLVRDHPKVSVYAELLGYGCNELGILHAKLGHQEQALEAYEAARVLRKRLAREHPDRPAHAVGLGGTYCNLGHLLKAGDVERALTWYGKAIATLEPVSRLEPPPPLARLFLAKSYYGRADALAAHHRHPEALKDLDRVLALYANDPSARQRQAATLAHLGEHARAAAAVEELAALTRVSAACLYDLAGTYSLCAAAADKDGNLAPAERNQTAEKYAAQAVALLRRAVQAGFEGLAQAKKDTALDPLRRRADFKQLLAELEGAPKK